MNKNKKILGVALAVGAVVVLVSGMGVFAATTGSLFPVRDGLYRQWIPKFGVDHYAMVDEPSCNGTIDFNATMQVGARDSYGIDIVSVPNGATITSISIKPCASKHIRSGGASILN